MPAADPTPAPRPFTGMNLDRVSAERKDPAWVRRLAEKADTRAVLAGREGVLMHDGEHPALVRVAPEADLLEEPILLGLEGQQALFALDLDDRPQSAGAGRDGGHIVSLREAGTLLNHAE